MQMSSHLNEATAKPLTDSVWGDGLEELSLTTLWYPCSWVDVAQDELILYMPSLAHEAEQKAASGIGNERAIAHLRDALCARVFHSLSRFADHEGQSSELSRGTVNSFANYVEDLFRTDLAGILTFSAALERGEVIYRDWFAAPRPTFGWQLRRWRASRPLAEHNKYALIELEMLVLEAVVASLAAALGESRRQLDHDIDAMGFDARGLRLAADARNLLAALHTGFNVAYLFPELQVHHHLYTLAGWLGWLNRGRKAYLPTFIAEYLIDLLEQFPGRSDKPVVDALLTYYAERIGGTRYLLKAARRVLQRQHGLLINPQRLIWREDLRRIIDLMAELAKSEASDGKLPSFDGGRKSPLSRPSFLTRRM
jgi:hypothetical protein